MELVYSNLISDPLEILDYNIVALDRQNGFFSSAATAIRALDGLLSGKAHLTIADVPDFGNAPKRKDFPDWRHPGRHVAIAKSYWDWFHYEYPTAKLNLSDSPDFYGEFDTGALFFGDINQVSVSTLLFTLRTLRANDLWISIINGGHRHVIIEPLVNLCHQKQKPVKVVRKRPIIISHKDWNQLALFAQKEKIL